MTMPAQPAQPNITGSTTSTEAPTAQATPAEPAKTEPIETPEQKIERLEAAVKAANAEAAKARTTAKQNAADEARKELAQTIGKALGVVEDEAIDPVKLTEQVATATAEAKAAKVELSVFRAAAEAGADALALLDSRTFMAKLADVDPNDMATVTAAITEAVSNNPAFAPTSTAPRPPKPNPAQGSGSGVPAHDPAAQFAAILSSQLK